MEIHERYMFSIPFELAILGWPVNVHLVLEYVAFFSAFQYYRYLRRHNADVISNSNRLSIILGAAIGAFLGSRLMGLLENPVAEFANVSLLHIYNTKTITGGLVGGLLGVELAKVMVREPRSSGDLFTLPLMVGIFIGRIGCFLTGTNEFTYGSETDFFMGMNLGDGLRRHPLALYELIFLTVLFVILKGIYERKAWENGMLFKVFMVSYFLFRFMIEFLKPNVFFLFGLSSIQWLCVIVFVYYRRTILTATRAYT